MKKADHENRPSIALFPISLSVLALIILFPNIIPNIADILTGDMNLIGFIASLFVFNIPFIGFVIIAVCAYLKKSIH